jgi:coenzyme Q-binding protein COQ10
MPVKKTIIKTIKCTPMQAVEVILNIGSYPSFVPWCTAVTLTSKPINVLIKDKLTQSSILSFGYKLFDISFKSVNELQILTDNSYKITTTANQKPFKYLNNTWQLSDNKDGQTIIIFNIEYELSNLLLQKASTLYINKVAEDIVKAFENKILK